MSTPPISPLSRVKGLSLLSPWAGTGKTIPLVGEPTAVIPPGQAQGRLDALRPDNIE
jgi:hypothetical protein